MTLALNDRVQQTGTANTTVSFTLSGAVTGFQSFAVVGNGNTTYYGATDATGNWEVGIGTYSTTGPTLTRTTILASSNSGSAVTFSGSVSVFVTYPSEKSVNLDADGVMAVGEPIGYADTGVIATFASTVAGYNQVVIQNKSTATNASSNLNVSHNSATDTSGFAELGINSTTFTGAGSFSIPGASYLASASTDLTVGTYGAYDLHFVTNSNTTDSMTIFDDGGVSLGGLSSPGLGNIACNNINLSFQQVATTGGTTYLTNASPYYTQFTGTNTQILQLPDATTCQAGATFIFDNDSTQDVTIKDGAGTTFELLVPGGFHTFVLESNSTIAGTWLRYSQVPSAVEWGTLSLSLGATVISGGTWQGGTIQPGYGGTGLTTFTGANNALYSTSSSALTAGTLPVAAGGTGSTSFTTNYIPYSNGSTLTSSSSLQFNGSSFRAGAATPLGGATNPIATFTGSSTGYVQTYIYNSTNGTGSSADLVAYANNSTDASGWADMGFTSQSYADSSYTVTGPNEAYVFGSAPSGAGSTGNLVFATDSTGSANSHQWYVGGFAQNKNAWKMQLTSTGLQLATALNKSYGGTGLTSAGAAGNVLTSDGTNWTSATPSGSNITTQGLYENAKTISTNYSLTAGNNAMSAGPITVASGASVTVPAGSVWTVV
jgi:hypothetical protein